MNSIREDTTGTDRKGWYAALATCPDGSVLSFVSAVRAWGLPVPWEWRRDRRVHVSVPPPAFPPSRRRGIVGHRGNFSPGDVALRAGLPLVSPPRLFLDLAASLPAEQLVALGDAMLFARVTTHEELAERIDRAGGRRGVFRARQVVPILDERAQSPPESILRVRVQAAGLPDVEPQYAVRVSPTRVLHVDLGFPEYRVAVEHEGRNHYDSPAQFQLDLTRQCDLAAADWTVLRSTALDLAHQSGSLLAKLSRSLANRGWAGPISGISA